ncbi:MAG: hypothetical protein HRU26_07100 [Psychroserpens sp.]|nr:hypothetical protein [Psychroserpens sp.]
MSECDEHVATMISSKFANIGSFIEAGMAFVPPELFVYCLKENVKDARGKRIVSICASEQISKYMFE